jgi:hypothetical protein
MGAGAICRVAMIAILSTSFFSGIAAPSAMAATTKTPPPGWQYATTSIGGQVLVPSETVTGDKEAWLAAHPISSHSGSVTPMSGTTSDGYIYSAASLKVSGSDIHASGHTQVTSYYAQTQFVFRDSNVIDSWDGSGNPTAISPSMKWWINGVGVSVQIPAGVGFGGGGSAVTYAPGAVSGYSYASADYSYGIVEWCAIADTTNFQSYGDFLFGNSWYRVNGN